MNIESKVTSLELSKKLKEIGIKQESLFYWVKHHYYMGDENCFVEYHVNENIHTDYPDPVRIFSAFTVSELLEIIPKEINDHYIKIDWFNNEWCVHYDDAYGTLNSTETSDINMSNSLAEMIVYLVENGLMEVKNET